MKTKPDDPRTLTDIEARRRSDAVACLNPTGNHRSCRRPAGHSGACTSIPYADDAAVPVGCYIDPDGKARPTLVAGIHMECEICGAQPQSGCISMAKRYSGDYGCRGRAISIPSWARDRKTLHKERVAAAKAESERRVAAAAEYNARFTNIPVNKMTSADRQFMRAASRAPNMRRITPANEPGQQRPRSRRKP